MLVLKNKTPNGALSSSSVPLSSISSLKRVSTKLKMHLCTGDHGKPGNITFLRISFSAVNININQNLIQNHLHQWKYFHCVEWILDQISVLRQALEFLKDTYWIMTPEWHLNKRCNWPNFHRLFDQVMSVQIWKISLSSFKNYGPVISDDTHHTDIRLLWDTEF